MFSLLKTAKTSKFTFVSLSLAISLASCKPVYEPDITPVDSPDQAYKIKNTINGQIVVKFKQKITSDSVNAFAKEVGITPVKMASRLNTAVFKLDYDKVEDTLSTLKENPNIDYAERNYKVSNKYTVNDPKAVDQRGMAIVKLPKAWDITFGSPNVIIAVVDTGIDMTHPDLKNKIVTGYNVITQGKTPPMDDNGHGTHASGIAGAETNNKVGVAGTAPLCKLMPVKALDAKGSGDTANVALGIVWAADHGARVINMSLGGPQNETLKRAVEYALAKNVVVVAAMGNDGKNVKAYPAALPGVISVGSVDYTTNQRSDFSNYGSWISVAAPGSNILSTMPTYKTTMTEMEKSEGYDYLDGTSMACPMVAGLAALVLSRYPNYTPAEVKKKIESTAIDLGKPGFDNEYGYGLINAEKAVL